MSEELRVETYTGGTIDVLNPHPDDVSIHDIAHALSLLCRWNGTSKYHFSVAQHSLFVAEWIEREGQTAVSGVPGGQFGVTKKSILQGLLHDAAEAYVNDIIRPIKHHPSMANYREMEDKVRGAIFLKFGVEYDFYDVVKEADEVALYTEASMLLQRKPAWIQQHKVASNLKHLLEKKLPEEIRIKFVEKFIDLM